jgi:hypothetical protein
MNEQQRARFLCLRKLNGNGTMTDASKESRQRADKGQTRLLTDKVNIILPVRSRKQNKHLTFVFAAKNNPCTMSMSMSLSATARARIVKLHASRGQHVARSPIASLARRTLAWSTQDGQTKCYSGPKWSHSPLLRPPTICVNLATRSFASSSPPETDFTNKLPRLEDANPERIRGIQVSPDSVGNNILPGNLVYKKYRFSGNTRKVPMELTHGYFWMMWDLRNTDGKPTLANETLIPEEDAQLFPLLTGLKTLNKDKADLPFFFVENNGKYLFPRMVSVKKL